MSGLELPAIAAIATLGAAAVGAGASVYGGMAERDQAEAIARQEILAGKNEFASAQRNADERKLEGAIVMSRQQAAAAASGAGAGDDAPTIVKIMGDTAARTQYGVESELYRGAQAQDDYTRSARDRRATGQYNFYGGILRGVGRGLGGFGDWAGAQG